MGVRIENHCCCCELPCRGTACSLRRVPVAYCDKCGDDAEKLYERDGGILCEDCFVEAELQVAEKVKSVSGSCTWCGEESNEFYLIDGEGVCEECFIEDLLEANAPIGADSLAEDYA